MFLKACTNPRPGEPVVALAAAPPAAGDAAGVCDPRGAPGLVATLWTEVTLGSKIPRGTLVALSACKSREAVARGQEGGRCVADAATVAWRETDAVAICEEGELAIPCAHYQVHIIIAVDVTDRWGATFCQSSTPRSVMASAAVAPTKDPA